MRLTLLLVICLLLSHCKNEPKAPTETIASLEAQLAKEPNQATLEKLLALYKEAASKAENQEKLDLLWKTGETARAVQNFSEAESAF